MPESVQELLDEAMQQMQPWAVFSILRPPFVEVEAHRGPYLQDSRVIRGPSPVPR